jgi:uncharacterized membrane protein YphA (DoxX/SURF4 family)
MTMLGWAAAVLIGLLFLISGIWKITDPQSAAIRMAQARVPESLSLWAAVLFGIAETVSGALVLVPRFRRWGALGAGALLIAFMVYVGAEYNALRGADCSCFPWVKRIVGPGFFAGDGAMLALAAIAGWWAPPARSRRSAAVVAGAVVVFALVSFGVGQARQTGAPTPAFVTVGGEPYSIARGKVFVFFFDPECMHCFEAAKSMSQLDWGDTRVVAVPVELPQYAAQFLSDTGLKAVVSTDFQSLKQTFHYTSYPFGVAVESGRQTATVTKFDADEPAATLRRLNLAK